MQICDIILRISPTDGALTEIPRSNVTPAEVVILRETKGDNSVRFNGNLRQVNRSNGAEINRLQSAYGTSFEKIFPGRSPFIPKDFSDVDLDTTRIMEMTPYVPSPDEAPELEEFTPIDDAVEVVPMTSVTTLVPTAKVRKTRARAIKPREDFSADA